MSEYNHFGNSVDTSLFNAIAEALNGSGGYQNGGNLVRYSREQDDKFLARKQLAFYVNYLKPACTRFTGYLSKKPPDREIEHPLLSAFADDCDWKGNSLDVFFNNFAIEAKARGCGLLLVEMPSFQPATLEQQLETRFFPYLVQLFPESIRRYSINNMGMLDFVEIMTTQMVDEKLQNVIRGWDAEKWWVSLNGNIIEGDAHNLGQCPVLAFSEGSTFPYQGDFAQIAGISKRIYNLRSELDEISRSQVFSILCYQLLPEQLGQVNPSNLAESVGTSNMLLYSGTQAPSFATPSMGPSDTIQKTIDSLETKIKDISLTIDLGKTVGAGPESGIALNIRFQSLNAALVSFGRKMEDLERRMFEICSKWLGIQNTVKVSYPRSYELADLSTELLTLASYQSSNFPTEVIQEKQRQIVQLDFSNLEADELQELLDAIDNMDAETPLIESRLAVLEAANQPPPDPNVEDAINGNMPMDMGELQ
jgi:hypothetical protein